jgi:hypothetical protein
MLTREQRFQLRLETSAAAGIDAPATMMTVRRAGGPPPGAVSGAEENQLALLRAQYAQMITAARASVTARRAGTADPLAYIEAELARHGGLPPGSATVPAVLADAATAMDLAGRGARPCEPARAAW